MIQSNRKIGLDVRMLDYSGIGTTIREFLRHSTPERLTRLVLFHGDVVPKTVCHRLIYAPYKVYGLSQHFLYPGLIRGSGVALYHMPHYDAPYFLTVPSVVTVHDLIHILYPEFSTKPFSSVYAKALLSNAVRKARRILVVSENTKKDLIALLPSAEGKIRVVYPGVDRAFRPLERDVIDGVLARHEIPGPYWLYVGNLRKSKNTDGLLRIYRILRDKMKGACPELVLVGKNFLPEFESTLPPGVRHLGAIPTGDLPALYAGAGLFLFPTLYEGFGLPPIEAMASGVPVVASNRASLPEVCGDAAVLVDPLDEAGMAGEIEAVWGDPKRRESMIEKGFKNAARFDWKHFAESTWAVYDDVLAELQS